MDISGGSKMYILKCYVFANKEANLIQAFKTKKSAENRQRKAIESKCYEKVELIRR